MKRLLKTKSAKNYGDLYHYTYLASLYNILKTDELSTNHGFVCFTRDQNFPNVGRFINSNMECRITFDGEKLSQNIKINPYRDPSMVPKDIRNPQLSESEERTYQPITSVNKYIKGITIYKKSYDKIQFNIMIQDFLTPDEYEYWLETETISEEVLKKEKEWESMSGWENPEWKGPEPISEWYESHDKPKELDFDNAIEIIKSIWHGGITIL
jgi:hypothetical protein